VDNLNVVIIAQQVRLPNGSPARRVTSINELIGYDSVSDSFSFIEAFSWRPETDSFLFRGDMNSYLLEQKIAPRRGILYEKRQQIYSMVKQRAEILRRLADKKAVNFYDLYATLSKAYREGHFK
jgi:flagellar protein FlaI